MSPKPEPCSNSTTPDMVELDESGKKLVQATKVNGRDGVHLITMDVDFPKNPFFLSKSALKIILQRENYIAVLLQRATVAAEKGIAEPPLDKLLKVPIAYLIYCYASTFKGKSRINVREFKEFGVSQKPKHKIDTDSLYPTKNGFCFTEAQFAKFCDTVKSFYSDLSKIGAPKMTEVDSSASEAGSSDDSGISDDDDDDDSVSEQPKTAKTDQAKRRVASPADSCDDDDDEVTTDQPPQKRVTKRKIVATVKKVAKKVR